MKEETFSDKIPSFSAFCIASLFGGEGLSVRVMSFLVLFDLLMFRKLRNFWEGKKQKTILFEFRGRPLYY